MQFVTFLICVARPDSPGIRRVASGLERLESRAARYGVKLHMATSRLTNINLFVAML